MKRIWIIVIVFIVGIGIGYALGHGAGKTELDACIAERNRIVKRGVIAQGLLGVCVGDPMKANEAVERMLAEQR